MRPEPIKALGAREARTQRAVERWLESNDAKDTPLDVLVAKATESASNLARDLTPHEIATVCTAAVVAYVHDQEQRLAREALSDEREQDRLAYLAKQAAYYKLLADEPRRG